MRTWLALLAGMALYGCGSTPYQPYDKFRGGYRTTQLDVDVYKVEFLGNEYTDSTIAGDFGLLRSAEVCLENGYPYFSRLDGGQVSNFTAGGMLGGGITQGRGVYTIKCQKERTGNSRVGGRTLR